MMTVLRKPAARRIFTVPKPRKPERDALAYLIDTYTKQSEYIFATTSRPSIHRTAIPSFHRHLVRLEVLPSG